MNRVRTAVTTALLCCAAGAAAAQSTAPAGETPAAGSNATIPEKAPATTGNTAVPGTNLDTKPGTLSDKLSDTNGVIKPTGNVDPAMHVPAPQTGTMPVIKPGAVDKGTPK